MSQGTIAEQLFEDYNDHRRRTGHIQKLKQTRPYASSISRKHLPVFQELADWCSSQGIDPRRWLTSLFESRRWLFPPKLNQLQSKKHLQRYAKMDVPVYAQRVRVESQAAAVESGKMFDRARDLSHGAELLKRRYLSLGNHARCMAEMETDTFGYHPKSTVCYSCVARFECARLLQSKVNYDILSVRSGTMSMSEAQVARHVRGK